MTLLKETKAMMKFVRCAVVALLLMPASVSAHDINTAAEAFRVGDFARALRIWTPLAEEGNPRAQLGLGALYEQGHGVPQDYSEAAHWYRLAADQGIAAAQLNLGNMYALGDGVLQDYAEAVSLYRMAAAQGSARAQATLGTLHLLGEGLPRDNVAAHMWFNISAANGLSTGAEFRDAVARNMTAADTSEAQQRARVCMESGYQDCD